MRLRKPLGVNGRFEGRPASSSFVQPFNLKKYYGQRDANVTLDPMGGGTKT
jgi:hypothetical protein